MKNLLSLLILLAILGLTTGCGSGDAGKTAVPEKDTLSAPPPTRVLTDPRDSLSSLLEGFWMPVTYLDLIAMSKSIYGNRNRSTRFFGFTLEKGNLMSDTPTITAFGEHEGGYGTVLRFNDKLYRFENDTTYRGNDLPHFREPMLLELKTPNHISVQFPRHNKAEVYRRVTDDHTEMRRILFTGIYKDMETGQEVVFAEDGSVTGFPEASHYELLYDFGEGLLFDVVFMGEKDKRNEARIFHYAFDGDKLQLYRVEGQVPEYRIGDLAVDLMRQK